MEPGVVHFFLGGGGAGETKVVICDNNTGLIII